MYLLTAAKPFTVPFYSNLMKLPAPCKSPPSQLHCGNWGLGKRKFIWKIKSHLRRSSSCWSVAAGEVLEGEEFAQSSKSDYWVTRQFPSCLALPKSCPEQDTNNRKVPLSQQGRAALLHSWPRWFKFYDVFSLSHFRATCKTHWMQTTVPAVAEKQQLSYMMLWLNTKSDYI